MIETPLAVRWELLLTEALKVLDWALHKSHCTQGNTQSEVHIKDEAK